MSWADSVGVVPTRIPRASSASFFACAVPSEPEMIAPACPIVFPGGAVKPALEETTGFVLGGRGGAGGAGAARLRLPGREDPRGLPPPVPADLADHHHVLRLRVG